MSWSKQTIRTRNKQCIVSTNMNKTTYFEGERLLKEYFAGAEVSEVAKGV